MKNKIEINNKEEVAVAFRLFKNTSFETATAVFKTHELFVWAILNMDRNIDPRTQEEILSQGEVKIGYPGGVAHFITAEKYVSIKKNVLSDHVSASKEIIQKAIDRIREENLRLEEYYMRAYIPPISFQGVLPLIQEETA